MGVGRARSYATARAKVPVRQTRRPFAGKRSEMGH